MVSWTLPSSNIMVLYSILLCSFIDSICLLEYVRYLLIIIYDSTNATAGRVCTKLREEKPLPCCSFCGLGLQGTCVCVGTIPVGFYYPIVGVVCFGIISTIMRHQVVKKYGVIEEDYCCMKTPCNYAVNQLHFCCIYPCSFFQMDMAMEHWKKEAEMENNNVAPADVPPPSINES